jgi:hypothetical protein
LASRHRRDAWRSPSRPRHSRRAPQPRASVVVRERCGAGSVAAWL